MLRIKEENCEVTRSTRDGGNKTMGGDEMFMRLLYLEFGQWVIMEIIWLSAEPQRFRLSEASSLGNGSLFDDDLAYPVGSAYFPKRIAPRSQVIDIDPVGASLGNCFARS